MANFQRVNSVFMLGNCWASLNSAHPTGRCNRRLNHTQAQSRLLGRVEGRMEPVRGQDDRKRERHAMDGVWLPAGGENPRARGFPDGRPKPGPGIAKGEAFSPLARRRPPQVDRTPMPARRNRNKQNRTPTMNPIGMGSSPCRPNPKPSAGPSGGMFVAGERSG